MFLKHEPSGDLIEVMDIQAVMDPNREEISGRFHHGEEMQEAENFSKTMLSFPSGEKLPLCWRNPKYRH